MTRYERKFLVSFADYLTLSAQLKIMGTPDPNAGQLGRYPVFSRYFDTRDREFYHQKVEGEYCHTKIRRRVYNTRYSETQGSILEAKMKFSDRQLKFRLDQHSYRAADYPDQISELLEEITSCISLYPQCHVYYEREAYALVSDAQCIRINFDHSITAIPPTVYQINSHLMATNCADSGEHVLMEVKSPGFYLPKLVEDILSIADTRPYTFSKYVWACEFLNANEEVNCF